MVTVLGNAVIESQMSGMFTWRGVCGVCGTPDNCDHGANPPGQGQTLHLSFDCRTCHQTRDVVFTGTC